MDDEAERTLYCGNLDSRVTEDILFELFIQVRNVHLFARAKFEIYRCRLLVEPRPFISPLTLCGHASHKFPEFFLKSRNYKKFTGCILIYWGWGVGGLICILRQFTPVFKHRNLDYILNLE